MSLCETVEMYNLFLIHAKSLLLANESACQFYQYRPRCPFCVFMSIMRFYFRKEHPPCNGLVYYTRACIESKEAVHE